MSNYVPLLIACPSQSEVGLCFVETGLNGAALCADGENLPISVDLPNSGERVTFSRGCYDLGIPEPVEIVRLMREALGEQSFPIIINLSLSPEIMCSMPTCA